MVRLAGRNKSRGTGGKSVRFRWKSWTMLLVVLSVYLIDIRGVRAQADTVDLALVLGVDISNSVDWSEYRLQRYGLAQAIQHPDVVAAIRSGKFKRIAVSVVQWTDYQSQVITIPWTILSDHNSTRSLSKRIAKMGRFYGGHATHIAGMIKFGTWLLRQAPFTTHRKVIDISGDGHDNVTTEPGRYRDEAIAAGITINGLTIENEEKNLRHYYRDFVIGGPGAFVIRAKSYEDFERAMKKKLIREIAPKFLTQTPTSFFAAG